MKKSIKCFAGGMFFILAFIVFTILTKRVDLQPIGPEDSVIGFANLNAYIKDVMGYHKAIYNVTQITGYLALLVVAGFGLLGLMQLVKSKKLTGVDSDIYLLGGYYVVVLFIYALFEKVVINYRPIIVDVEEGLEASYPSSHTVLAICVFATAILQMEKRIEDRVKRRVVQNILGALLAITLIGRLLSGVHWFTDICGGVLISLGLVLMYFGGYYLIEAHHEEVEE